MGDSETPMRRFRNPDEVIPKPRPPPSGLGLGGQDWTEPVDNSKLGVNETTNRGQGAGGHLVPENPCKNRR